MRQALHHLSIPTRGKGLIEITEPVRSWVHGQKIATGLLTLFCRHTSASLLIQENADPDVQTDLITALRRLAPADAGWVHTTEGPDDMPAHIKTMVAGMSLHVPVVGGELTLGTWQAIYLVEHRARPHRREIILQFVGHRR